MLHYGYGMTRVKSRGFWDYVISIKPTVRVIRVRFGSILTQVCRITEVEAC